MMRRVGQDARIVCGMDLRRAGVSPEDHARAEAWVGRYGGTVALYPVGDAAVAVEWYADAQGPVVRVTGATVGEAFATLRERVA